MWTEKCEKNETGKMRVRRRDARVRFFVLGVFAAVFLFTFLGQNFKKLDEEVEAASLANFDPGYIISDYQMGNYNSMSEAEIQAFLTAKNSCGNTDYEYYLALSRGSVATWHFENGHFVCLSEELFGDGEVIGSGETAAHIIWQTAQDYRINPQVLLVLLQKETGLITDPIPNNYDYRKATGYGCPDTAPCSSQYYGFKNQVRRAAALFRTVLDGGWTNYPLGENYVQYNPNAACGGSIVNIRSLATSALYRYTPYQPNEGALAAGYGTAYCGAYGNRNFYLYFEDWFGGVTDDELKDCDVFCDMPENEYGKEAIKWMYENGITQYYSKKGEFAPNEEVTGSQFGIFLERYQQKYPDGIYNNPSDIINSLNKIIDSGVSRGDAVYYLYLLSDSPVKSAFGFEDLPSDSYGRLAVDWAYENGITKYYSRVGEFAPYANITRREVAIFLWRLAGAPEVDLGDAGRIFDDLPNDELGKKAIVWAYNNNITKYYSRPGEFAPYANITRREVAIFLWKKNDMPSVYKSDLNDLPDNPLIANAINWAYENRITEYYSRVGEFAPDVKITRYEVAIFLYRLSLLQKGTL